MVIENEDVAMSYYRIHQQIEKYSVEMEEFIQKPKYCVPYLQRGRLVKVTTTTTTNNRRQRAEKFSLITITLKVGSSLISP